MTRFCHCRQNVATWTTSLVVSLSRHGCDVRDMDDIASGVAVATTTGSRLLLPCMSPSTEHVPRTVEGGPSFAPTSIRRRTRPHMPRAKGEFRNS